MLNYGKNRQAMGKLSHKKGLYLKSQTICAEELTSGANFNIKVVFLHIEIPIINITQYEAILFLMAYPILPGLTAP